MCDSFLLNLVKMFVALMLAPFVSVHAWEADFDPR